MKYALVTGGTRGIGLAVCRALSDAGYCVTATYSRDEAGAQAAQKTLPFVHFERVDVRDEEGMRALIAALPALDVLVNNAGISHFAQVQDVSMEAWEEVMGVNAGGVFLACKYAVKKLLARGGGAIVNVSSVWGQTGASCESVYSASKGAVIAFSKALAKELASAHITVNCVCPGMIATPMNDCFTKEERAAICEEIPLAREGRAEEVAAAVLALIQNEYITGAVLPVNGGMYC